MKADFASNKEIPDIVQEFSVLVRELHGETNERLTDLERQMQGLRQDFQRLESGQFTMEEKEDLMANIRHINERLENEALGKKDITLTRSEYDRAALGEPFVNRFSVLTEVPSE